MLMLYNNRIINIIGLLISLFIISAGFLAPIIAKYPSNTVYAINAYPLWILGEWESYPDKNGHIIKHLFTRDNIMISEVYDKHHRLLVHTKCIWEIVKLPSGSPTGVAYTVMESSDENDFKIGLRDVLPIPGMSPQFLHMFFDSKYYQPHHANSYTKIDAYNES